MLAVHCFYSAPYYFPILYIGIIILYIGSQYRTYNKCLASFHVTLQPKETFIKNESSFETIINPLNINPTKWLNTLKQFVGCCRRNF